MYADEVFDVESGYDPEDDEEVFDPEAELDMMFPDGGPDDGWAPDTWPGDDCD